MYGTGESGVRYKMTKEEYFSECDAKDTVEFFCGYFEVPEPTLRKNPTPINDHKFSGMYYPKTGVLSYNRDMTGLIIHELAHHIAHKLGRNGKGHHNSGYWSVLQEMHDLW